MAKVINRIGEKVTFLELERGSSALEEQKDFVKVLCMLFGCLAED